VSSGPGSIYVHAYVHCLIGLAITKPPGHGLGCIWFASHTMTAARQHVASSEESDPKDRRPVGRSFVMIPAPEHLVPMASRPAPSEVRAPADRPLAGARSARLVSG
jgi:hypothetical protein